METPIFILQFTFYDSQLDCFVKRCVLKEIPEAQKIGELFAKLAEDVAVTPTDIGVQMQEDEPTMGYIRYKHYDDLRTGYVDIFPSIMFS